MALFLKKSGLQQDLHFFPKKKEVEVSPFKLTTKTHPNPPSETRTSNLSQVCVGASPTRPAHLLYNKIYITHLLMK